LSTSSATLPDLSLTSIFQTSANTGGGSVGLVTPFLPLTTTGLSTTVYLSTYARFTLSTATASGNIYAVRI